MIGINFTHPPKPAGTDALPDIVATVRNAVAKFPGFPGYIFHNPDQWGSSGEGMGYPYSLYGPAWKDAYTAAAPGLLWPRIGGCATHDLPPTDGPIDTLCKRLRPSTVVLCDFASSDEAKAESDRFQSVIHKNGMVFAPEANAIQSYITPGATNWIVAEWFLWDVPLPVGATSGWKPTRWKIRDWLAASPDTKVIVEVTSDSRHTSGFVNGCPDWPAQKVAIAKSFHAIDPARVLVSVRGSGLSAAQVAELRGLNQ